MSSFTRGPWHVIKWNKATAVALGGEVVAADQTSIAVFNAEWIGNGDEASWPTAAANAYLIAAAPDLFAVVEAAVEQWGAMDPSSLRLWEANMLVVARAALAKARGE